MSDLPSIGASGAAPVVRSELELIVTGMSCRHCVRDVTARLRDVPGVRTVVANAGTSRVRLGGTMAASDVLAALAGTKYTFRMADDPPGSRR